MFTWFSLHSMVRRSLAVAVFAGAGLAVAGAQSTAPAAGATAAQPIDFKTASVPAVTGNSADALFSSSNPEGYDPQQQAATQLASVEKTFAMPDANMQYGQRRRYGAPRYRGSNTNADGSEKYTAYAGVGLTLPVGDLHNYDTPSWGFQVGVGRNFNKRFGVNFEFAWDEFGLQGNVLEQQGYVEDPTNAYGLQGNTDGYSHIWSFSLQPVYNIKTGDTWGAYVTGGAGFYHKITTFTTPETGCDPYYLEIYGVCIAISANEPFDSYTSNAPGFDGGFGVTYKFSRFANERFYAEARYVYMLNQQKAGIDGSNYLSYGPDYNYPTTNLYPANSRRSSYIPVKFGIRF